MPCFSSGPTPGTREYDEWLPRVRAELDSFTHVVDFYYRKAGLPVPVPAAHDEPQRFRTAEELALAAAEPVDPGENARVLHQILLHLDCDGVDMLRLHDLRLLLHADPASEGHRYDAVLAHCFGAMRLGFRERPSNEAQWGDCRSPGLMLDAFGCQPSDRKLRLFAAACCRRVPGGLADGRCRAAVEVAERFADGLAGAADLAAAAAATEDVKNHGGTDSPATWASAERADEAARMAALFASIDSDAGRETEEEAQASLLRCVLGNPFRPVTLSPGWRTGIAVALARQMYDSADFSAMPILADALQDAGCGDEQVLTHCRGPGPHARGCWVIDMLLGKS